MRVRPYTTESLRKIQTELEKDSIFVGYVTLGKILDTMGYCKQFARVGDPWQTYLSQGKKTVHTVRLWGEQGQPG